MADIFLSYSSSDREQVLPLVEALQEDGFSVWWDRDIRPGPSFDREIEQAIAEARCLVVAWSAESVESEWVRSEVEEGVRRGILVPVIIESVLPPLAYRRRQTADLSDWQGARDGEYAQLVSGIRATLEGGDQTVDAATPSAPHGSATPKPRRRKRKVSLPMALASIAAIFVVTSLGTWMVAREQLAPSAEKATDVTRLELSLPQGMSLDRGLNTSINITPDGQAITFQAWSGTTGSSYYVRHLNDFSARKLEVSSIDLGSHWLSPDGKALVYNDIKTETYRKVPLAGGSPIALVPTGRGFSGIRGLALNDAGELAFASASPGISLLATAGAAPTALTEPPDGSLHENPRFVEDGSALLFTERASTADKSVIKVLDRETGEITTLAPGDQPRLSASGHLVMRRDSGLWAAPFDAETLSLRGDPVMVLEGLSSADNAFAIADNGTLVYAPAGETTDSAVGLVWATPEGAVEPIAVAVSDIGGPRVSPDGNNILMHARAQGSTGPLNIWNHSINKETTTKLTFEEGTSINVFPQWAPDGARYLYVQFDPGASNGNEVYIGTGDGAQAPQAITRDASAGEASVAADGGAVLMLQCIEVDSCDLARATDNADDTAVEVLLETPFAERSPELSPDGRWLAYSSDESGRHEIYIRPYPELKSRRWQVSVNGGETPMWSKDGGRLFFVQRSSNEMMEASVSSDDNFNWSPPRSVLNLETYEWNVGPRSARNFDISNDGEAFLLVRERGGVVRLRVVLNWLNELERLVPTD
jgi:Tol biopolymer transport system component